jgi:cobalt-zinc-cadmium efflux system outer membrane protein
MRVLSTRRWLPAALICFALASAPGFAEEPGFPAVLTLEIALRMLHERSLDLLLAEAQVSAVQGDERVAHAVANPAVSASLGKSFNYDASACAGCSATSVGFGISDQAALFDALSGKRGLRIDVARAALAAARLSREDAERTVRLTLEQALVDAALQRAQLDFNRELLAFAQRTEGLEEKRLHAGAISEAELARAEVAALEAAQALDLAEQAERTARSQVAVLLAVEGPLPDFRIDPALLERVLDLIPTQASSESLLTDALATRPDLLALEQQEARARTALTLALRQRIPDVTFSASYTQEGTGAAAITPPTLTFGLSLPLPIFYQQQGEVARAEADLRAQTLQLRKVEAQLASEVGTAFTAFATSRTLIERMQTRLLERARRARDLVEIQYEKGAASLLELLDAQRAYAQTQTEYRQDLHDLWVALFKLQAAVGKELQS